MRLRSVLLAGVVLLVAGCAWPMAGQAPDRRAWAVHDTTVTPANVGSLHAGWVGAVTSPPAEVVGDHDLLVVHDGTNATALDPATGAPRWSRWLPGTGTPGLLGSAVYLPASDTRCSIVQADRATGVTIGRLDLGITPPPLWTSSCVAGDVVVDGDTIIVPWRQAMTKAGPCGLNTTVASGLTAYTADLTVRWFDSSSVAVCDAPPVPAHLLPRVSRIGDRYVAAATGEPAKVYDPSGCVTYSVCKPVAAAIATTGIWVGGATSWTSRNTTQLWGTDAVTAALVWQSTDPSANATRTVTADPAFDNDHAFAPSGVSGSANLGVYALAGCGKSSCGPQWTVALPALAAFRPSIAGDVVLVATSDGHLVFAGRTGCSASSCPTLRSLALAGTPTAPPSIVAGRILVPTTAGIETYSLPA